MLKRLNRLVTDRDFKRLFKKGRRFRGPGINLVAIPNGLKTSRFGFVVGTKVDKRAVVRNRIQRQMREIVRLRIADLRPGFDCAMITDKKVLEMDFEAIKSTIFSLLKGSGLLV